MSIQLTIVTPEGEKYRGEVEIVVLPGTEGDFGVLANHERFLTPLRIGEVEIGTPEGETIFASIAAGFADVSAEEVVVLAESCEAGREIDAARADLARSRAEQDLTQLGADPDAQRRTQFEEALERARNRLTVSEKSQRV